METKATIKNVNLRAENSGDEGKIGAFDLSLDMPYTDEMHDYLCKDDGAPSIEQLIKTGVESFKLNTEYDLLILEFGDHKAELAKLNNASVEFGTNNKCKIRIQAHLGNAHGMAEALNVHTGELLLIDISDEKIVIKAAQGDLLADDGDQTESLTPAPNAENVHRMGEENVSDNSKDKDSSAIHVEGDKGEKLTPEEIKQREKEKQALLKRTKKSKPSTAAEDEAEIAKQMIADLSGTKFGQGDDLLFNEIKEKIENGRTLTNPQAESLVEIHTRYMEMAA